MQILSFSPLTHIFTFHHLLFPHLLDPKWPMEKWRVLHPPKIWVITYNPQKNEGFGVQNGRKHIQKIPFPQNRSAKMWRFTGSLRRKALRCSQSFWPFGLGGVGLENTLPKTKRTNFPAPKKGGFPKRKRSHSNFQPSIFRCKLAVSFREG